MREYALPSSNRTRTRDIQEILRQYFLTELETEYFSHGYVDVVEENGNLLGVALWLPPATKLGTAAWLKQLAVLARLLGPGILRALRMRRFWQVQTPKFPHWYLYTLATSPEARGKGVGTALLESGLTRCDGEPVYLEATSERAAQLYSRFGFIKLGSMRAHGDAEEIAMWRPENPR